VTTSDPAAVPPSLTVVLLTEEALQAGDASRIAGLHDTSTVTYRVLVPADTERNLLVDVLDHLSMLELRQALHDLRGEPDPARARAQASQALEESLAALRAAGHDASGQVTGDDPLPSLVDAVAAAGDLAEVVVVTRPHAVEDTFHRDWASRAREVLGVPVLHVYAGTTFLG
jgi:hypothetical protein